MGVDHKIYKILWQQIDNKTLIKCSVYLTKCKFLVFGGYINFRQNKPF
jgi:uncharacterized protein YlaN (UPF0358 family)